MLCKLSFSNIRRSLRDYAIYFFTLMIGVAVFYVFNAVSDQSQDLFRSSVAAVGRRITHEMHVSIDAFNPITILTAE